MSTIREEWMTFKAAVVSAAATEEQLHAMRVAFYTGVATAGVVLSEAQRNGHFDEVNVRWMLEMREFSNDLEKGSG